MNSTNWLEYIRPVLSICLHYVPNGLKLRGHLSELQRESAAILSIELDNAIVSAVKALKVREGSPLDVPLMFFLWIRKPGCIYIVVKSLVKKKRNGKKKN